MTTLQLGPGLRVGSLFSGYGGLDEGFRMVAGGRLVFVAEHEPPSTKAPRPSQAPARVLAHRYPDIPNLGDVSLVDWAPWVGGVDVLTGGFPCQDVSAAGLRKGLQVGTRSGLWYQFARAIDELRPSLVLIENVPGLRSARAGDPEEVTGEEAGELEPGTAAVGRGIGGDRPVLRALGAVLGDLAELGYDAEWLSVRASDVGAPHRRERVFILAWPRDLAEIRAA